jgi:hypothetical protein
MKIYAFDVDETLEVSDGPIKLDQLVPLCVEGHVLGLCGNWAALTTQIINWHDFFSFLGPMEMTKAAFLTQIRDYVPADEYIMVGNIAGVTGSSDDQGAALSAGWRFISEMDFANGSR